jgi:hypothetical protein
VARKPFQCNHTEAWPLRLPRVNTHTNSHRTAGVCILPNNYVPEIVGVLKAQAVASIVLRCEGPDVSVLTTVGNVTNNFIDVCACIFREGKANIFA